MSSIALAVLPLLLLVTPLLVTLLLTGGIGYVVHHLTCASTIAAR
ncbi:hypothetical protein [Streptomyces sp. NPDC002054]